MSEAASGRGTARRGWRLALQAGLTLACLLLLAALQTAAVRTWLADRAAVRATQPGSDAAALYLTAAHWRPDVAEYWRLAAESNSFAAPHRALALARTAVALAPRNWQTWETLALLQLQLGNSSAALTAMHQATRFDRGFDAHYAMSNLALVEGDPGTYRSETRAVLAVAPAARVPIVLGVALRQFGNQTAPLLALLPPRRPEVNLEAMDFFLDTKHVGAAVQAWRRVSCASYRQLCQVALQSLLDEIMRRGFVEQGTVARQQVEVALSLWNQAVASGLLPQLPMAVGRLSNGDFAQPWFGANLSWQDSQHLPLEVAPEPTVRLPRIAMVSFSGDEPEQVSLFYRYLPVEASAHYLLSYQSRGVETNGVGGVLTELATGTGQILAVGPARLDEQWQANQLRFAVPAGIYVVRLSLDYARPLGATRLRGQLQVGNFQLAAQAVPPPRPGGKP